jgi:hypothetical protein
LVIASKLLGKINLKKPDKLKSIGFNMFVMRIYKFYLHQMLQDILLLFNKASSQRSINNSVVITVRQEHSLTNTDKISFWVSITAGTLRIAPELKSLLAAD